MNNDCTRDKITLEYIYSYISTLRSFKYIIIHQRSSPKEKKISIIYICLLINKGKKIINPTNLSNSVSSKVQNKKEFKLNRLSLYII